MCYTRHFGRIIRNKRKTKGLTIKELAELCDLSERGLSLIELGDSDPKLSNVIGITKALEIDMGDLAFCKRINKREER